MTGADGGRDDSKSEDDGHVCKLSAKYQETLNEAPRT